MTPTNGQRPPETHLGGNPHSSTFQPRQPSRTRLAIEKIEQAYNADLLPTGVEDVSSWLHDLIQPTVLYLQADGHTTAFSIRQQYPGRNSQWIEMALIQGRTGHRGELAWHLDVRLRADMVANIPQAAWPQWVRQAVAKGADAEHGHCLLRHTEGDLRAIERESHVADGPLGYLEHALSMPLNAFRGVTHGDYWVPSRNWLRIYTADLLHMVPSGVELQLAGREIDVILLVSVYRAWDAGHLVPRAEGQGSGPLPTYGPGRPAAPDPDDDDDPYGSPRPPLSSQDVTPNFLRAGVVTADLLTRVASARQAATTVPLTDLGDEQRAALNGALASEQAGEEA